MKTATGYACDYCNFMRARNDLTRRHEARCPHNPKNRTCKTCAERERVDLESDVYIGDGEVDQVTYKSW